jgi:hypothetical protein
MSWSEAVNTIESLDPVLHAGILEDVRNSGRVPETLRHPISSLNSTGRYHPLQERPGSRNRIEQRPRADNTPMGLGSRFHTLPEGAGSQLSDHTKVHCSKFEENREPVPGGVPCPHADCRPYPDVLYRPERRHDEEQSQMCLHLIHVHRTTPFPCGELNCERTGDRGYFMQMDLVRHVKIAHPYIAALHRLRGRVDSHLLDQSYDHAKSRSLIEAHRNSAPEFPHRDSDFMSPRPPSNHQIQSSTEPVSSSPDHDRTLTPRGTSSRFEAASTPKTSVSSFNLNHSAAPAKVVREANDSRPAFFTSDKLMDIEGSYMNVNNAESNEKKYPSPLKESVECEKTITLTSSVSPFQRMHDDHVQSTEPGFQVTVSDSRVDNIKPHLEANNERSNLSAAANSRSPKSRPPPSPSIPDSQSSQEAVHSSPPPPLPRYSNSSRDIRITTHLARNTVDPSYEFSDEEMVLDSVVMRPPSLSTVRPTETPRPASGLRAMTPALKKKLQKSLCKTLDSEDFDELSLGRDDFVLISSPSKSACRAPPSSQNRIKLEPIDTPQGVLPATVRKRKVGMVQDNDELDELAAQAPLVFSQLGSFSKSQPQIKAGVSKSTATNAPKADVTDLGHQGFETKQDYKVRVNGTDLHPSSQLASTPTTQSTRNRNRRKDTVPSTRLLNLTSDRNKQTKSREMKGVNESAPETSISSSSSRLGSSPSARRTKSQDEAASLDTPLVDATLPAQKNVLSEREEEVAVLVKTPGGTLRRCGEDGFSCRRSFCFRCSNWRGGL